MAAPDLVFTDQTTTDDDAKELISAANLESAGSLSHIYIVESAGNAALFSVDGGVSFSKLPASTGLALDNLSITGAVQVKNNAAGMNVTVSGRVW